MSSRKITKFNCSEARDFFLKSTSYVSIDLPFYINFGDLLNFVSAYMIKKDIDSVCTMNGKRLNRPCDYPDVNKIILSSKGKPYSLRTLQIIHPVLYVYLVRLMTEKDNWKYIQTRFEQFSKGYVDCISIPRESEDIQSDKASLVKFWWESIEQESIKKSLKYNFLFKTDISDCYGSIYTHSIEWALDEKGKEAVKERIRKNLKVRSLGQEIDKTIRSMSYNQTNGIPEGSVLMDFIAEIVLGYADEQLTMLIRKSRINRKDFAILRYRDDYRIFVNNYNVGQEIMRFLNAVLYDLGMKLNSEKTTDSNEVILSSIKPEKLERILISPSIEKNLQKEALRIYQISKKYPSSGLVAKELSQFFYMIEDLKELEDKEDLEVIITVFSMIGYFNPKVINWVSAIISRLLEFVEGLNNKKKLIKMIRNRYGKTSKIDLIDIWLQRISAPMHISIDYDDDLTKVAIGRVKNSKLWNCYWLKKELVSLLDIADISGLVKGIKEGAIMPAIQRSEVELFKTDYL